LIQNRPFQRKKTIRSLYLLGSTLHRVVYDHLVYRCWSPEQIAQRLQLMKPDDPSASVSHETIYAAIYAQPRGGLKAVMIEALRQAKPARGCRRTTLAGSAMVPESLRIINRPEEIEARLVPGHWEGDLIKGAFNCSSWARWSSARSASLSCAK
jgi:IS30 family transposase